MTATLTIKQLDTIQDLIFHKLVQQSIRIKTIVPCQLYLVERLVSQCRLLEKEGYCDYELAYILYALLKRYFEHFDAKIKGASDEIHSMVKGVIEKRAPQAEVIGNHLRVETNDDDLLDRFKELKEGSKSTITVAAKRVVASNGYQELVSPTDLHELVKDSKVLLIDYRPRKDYVHNHIKHPNVINIDPSLVNDLPNEATSQDLEAKLKHTMSHQKYKIFEDRQKFDYVVLYDFKFGVLGNNRFIEILKGFEQASVNPFQRLVELLTVKNPLISSRLKLRPIYLSGGIKNWYDIYGEEGIENSRKLLADVDMNGMVYPKSFDDYLSSARKSTPVELTKEKPRAHTKNNMLIKNQGAQVMGVQPYNPPSVGTIATKSVSKTNASSSIPASNVSSKPQRDQISNLLDEFATGLVNLGNSCYMNCMIQCLAATPQLTTFFFPSISMNGSYKQHINVNNKLGTQGKLTSAFVELLLNMLNNNGKVFSPSKFKKIAGECSPGRQFASCSQQDCTEFVTFLLDGLHEDLNQMPVLDPKEKKRISELTPEQEKNREILPVRLASTIEWERYLKLNFSIIVDNFQGQYLSQLRCLECGTTSTTYNAFSILTLPIPERLNQTHKVTLQDCIEEFTTTELLEDGNKWHCSHCKKFTRSTKKIAITRLPQVLIVNFKRFEVNTSGQIRKLETFVTYPVTEVLDLTKYWTKPGTIMGDANAPKMSIEEETTIIESFPVRNQEPPFRYKLYGVANHFGTLSTGHYTSYVYKRGKKRWCYFDDSKITSNVSPNEVMNKNAFCLFFQRV